MEVKTEEVLLVLDKLLANLGLQLEEYDFLFLTQAELYVEMFKIMFPELAPQLSFDFSQEEIDDEQLIQSLIDFLSKHVIKVDLDHISSDLITQGDPKHILNFIQLLYEISKMMTAKEDEEEEEGSESQEGRPKMIKSSPNSYKQLSDSQGGGSEPDWQANKYHTAQGIPAEFLENSDSGLVEEEEHEYVQPQRGKVVAQEQPKMSRPKDSQQAPREEAPKARASSDQKPAKAKSESLKNSESGSRISEVSKSKEFSDYELGGKRRSENITPEDYERQRYLEHMKRNHRGKVEHEEEEEEEEVEDPDRVEIVEEHEDDIHGDAEYDDVTEEDMQHHGYPQRIPPRGEEEEHEEYEEEYDDDHTEEERHQQARNLYAGHREDEEEYDDHTEEERHQQARNLYAGHREDEEYYDEEEGEYIDEHEHVEGEEEEDYEEHGDEEGGHEGEHSEDIEYYASDPIDYRSIQQKNQEAQRKTEEAQKQYVNTVEEHEDEYKHTHENEENEENEEAEREDTELDQPIESEPQEEEVNYYEENRRPQKAHEKQKKARPQTAKSFGYKESKVEYRPLRPVTGNVVNQSKPVPQQGKGKKVLHSQSKKKIGKKFAKKDKPSESAASERSSQIHGEPRDSHIYAQEHEEGVSYNGEEESKESTPRQMQRSRQGESYKGSKTSTMKGQSKMYKQPTDESAREFDEEQLERIRMERQQRLSQKRLTKKTSTTVRLKPESLKKAYENQQSLLYDRMRDEKLSYLKKIHKIIYQLDKKKVMEEKKAYFDYRRAADEDSVNMMLTMKQNYREKLNTLKSGYLNEKNERKMTDLTQKLFLKTLKQELNLDQMKEIERLRERWGSEKARFELMTMDEDYLEKRLMDLYKK